MTEALFYLSVGFVGYVIYVLVDEQRALNSRVVFEPVSAKPITTKTQRKTTAPTKAKSAVKTIKKAAPEPVNPTVAAILAYVGKNGLTTVAKLAKELPVSRKLVQDSIDRLSQEGALSLTTIGRAKAVALKI